MLEDEASKNKIGLWSDPNSIPIGMGKINLIKPLP